MDFSGRANDKKLHNLQESKDFWRRGYYALRARRDKWRNLARRLNEDRRELREMLKDEWREYTDWRDGLNEGDRYLVDELVKTNAELVDSQQRVHMLEGRYEDTSLKLTRKCGELVRAESERDDLHDQRNKWEANYESVFKENLQLANDLTQLRAQVAELAGMADALEVVHIEYGMNDGEHLKTIQAVVDQIRKLVIQ